MAKKMTMADIANLSGVGKSTVSRYFNGGYVKDETRAGIRSARPRIHSWLVLLIYCYGRYTKVLPSRMGVITLRQSSRYFVLQVSVLFS